MDGLLHRLRRLARSQARCQLCLATLEGDDVHPICPGCLLDLPWLAGHCRQCALPLPADGLLCGECQRRPPAFDSACMPWRYGFPLDALVTRFKHRADWPAGRLLAELFADHLQHTRQALPDLLLPVPLARARQRARGFNQAQMLADWLGRSLRLKVEAGWLLRTQDTPAQQGLDAATRRRNLRRAFALAPRARPAGLHLALVDDVLTTGTTAHALARLLKRAGAARVDVYCLARTPKPGSVP